MVGCGGALEGAPNGSACPSSQRGQRVGGLHRLPAGCSWHEANTMPPPLPPPFSLPPQKKAKSKAGSRPHTLFATGPQQAPGPGLELEAPPVAMGPTGFAAGMPMPPPPAMPPMMGVPGGLLLLASPHSAWRWLCSVAAAVLVSVAQRCGAWHAPAWASVACDGCLAAPPPAAHAPTRQPAATPARCSQA